MAVYQVAIIFEAESDERATTFAELLQSNSASADATGKISNAKIAFTKFEQEAQEVADKPVV